MGGLSFGLLAPLALALGVLLGGPILAHLTRRKPQVRVAFGAMMLLKRLSRRLRRRRRLRDLLLLLLRLLAVALAVLAVSQPEARWPGADPSLGGTGAVVIVLDNSLSMDLRASAVPGADATLLSRARDRAVQLIEGLPDATRVGLVLIGGSAQRLTPELSEDIGAVAAMAARVEQSQEGTDLAGGLREARRMLGGMGGEVVVLSDEAGPAAVPAAREEIRLLADQNVALQPEPIRPDVVANVAVVGARYGSGLEGGSVTVRMANFGENPVEVPLIVALPDGTEIAAFAEIPPGEVAEESVTVPRVADGGVGIARIRDGVLAADDAFAFQLPRVGASRVLVVDGDPGPTPTASEVYFLERALAPWGTSRALSGGVLPDVISSAGVQDLDPDVHRVVFLANLDQPGPLATRLVEFVREGGGLVLGMGDNVVSERYNEPLGLLLPTKLRKVRALVDPGEPGVATQLPDVGLALFQPFARGGRTAFGKASWRKLYTVQPYEETEQVRTLMRLEGGLPLLIERRLGQGRVLLFTGTLDNAWGDFPLQAAFMPWVQRLVAYLGGEAGGGGERLNARVGDQVQVPLPDAALDVIVRGPSGPVVSAVRNGAVGFRAETAGAYVVETPGAPPLAWVAVNVDAAESDVRAGPSLIATAAEVDPDRFLQRQALGPWLVGIVLILALLQALLSLVFSGRSRRPDPAAAPIEVPLAS